MGPLDTYNCTHDQGHMWWHRAGWRERRDFHLGHQEMHRDTLLGRGVIISVVNLEEKKKKQNPQQFGFPDPSLDAVFQPSPRQPQLGYGLLMFQRATEGCHILPSQADMHSPDNTEVNDIQFG